MGVTIDEWAAEVVRAQSTVERMARRLKSLERMGKREGFTPDEMRAAVQRQTKAWASAHAAEMIEVLRNHYEETGTRPRDPNDGRIRKGFGANARLRMRGGRCGG